MKEESFGLIKPEEYKFLGIDPADVPPGTYAAHKHPSTLLSRFGGNAYGFGFFEVYGRLNQKDLRFLQSVNLENPEQTRKCYKEINRIYKSIGLLIRFSSQGNPYYLIPIHLSLSSLSSIKNKTAEISKIIHFHRKKYMKESHKIGLLTSADDLMINELSLRFKEHEFVALDSLEKLRFPQYILDLVILPRDIFEIDFMEKPATPSGHGSPKEQLENYVVYLLQKIYCLLKPEGEIFVIANRFPRKTNRWIDVIFRSEQEEKNFILFSHIFRTKRKYRTEGGATEVYSFDFQKYLNPPYLEREVLDALLERRHVEDMAMEEIHALPYLNLPMDDEPGYDQEETWPKMLSFYFNQIFLKPLIPESIREEWENRFSIESYVPDYMFIYLGQKKTLQTTLEALKKDLSESRLSGCPLPLLADYRDSFDYLLRSLYVLKRIKGGTYGGLPELFVERLKDPLKNKKRRYANLNHVLRLMTKTARLERISRYLNPDNIEGARTQVLKNLETLSLFGFTYGELREILLIVVGHTPMGRILSGKMNEKTLKPVSDLARSHDPQEALNLLRYCRLMSMAETVASKKTDMNQEELTELFDLYEFTVKVVSNREMDWDRLLDENISAMGGVHNKVIRNVLKMMDHFQFLAGWSELSEKGEMEKEALADYDDEKLGKIERVIRLVEIIERFEEEYFGNDPFQAAIFYRKFLKMEFHGTGHIFQRLNSEFVWLLLWITVNVTRGDIINFNPLLSGADPSERDEYVRKLEEDAHVINTKYLDLKTLRRFSEQLYEDQTSFIMGTGFQLRVNRTTQAVDMSYIDMDENFAGIETLMKDFRGVKISDIPVEKLEELEGLFANLEGFYQSHVRLLSHEEEDLRPPERQRGWFNRAQDLKASLKSEFVRLIFQPEDVHTDLELLYRHSPTLLQFVIPEFMALQGLKPPEQGYLKSSLPEHVLGSVKKLQALIRRDRAGFQDVQILHKLAQREFGPMAAGTVGLNDYQIETLENLVQELQRNPPLFDGLIKSFIFRDLGLVPALRKKYKDEISPADHERAGALFLEKERISERYDTGDRASHYLMTLVRFHNLLHHMIRGEYSFYAVEEVVKLRDRELFDAIFVSSLIMFMAMGEDLIMEDLANRLFHLRTLCHRIMAGETTAEDYLTEVFAQKGHLFQALDAFQANGLPPHMAAASYLESYRWQESEREDYIRAGRMIYALERVFRLRGLRYVEFADLANLMVEVPLKYIYRKRNYTGIGYATFERELFEALRIYNSLRELPEEARHFVLERLVKDRVRIIGFEDVSSFLNYQNMIKLLLMALLGSTRFKGEERAVRVSFLGLSEQIERRYEAVNDCLSGIPLEVIFGEGVQTKDLFKAKKGIVLRKKESQRLLSIGFVDNINLSHKILHTKTIEDVEQLKNYFHYSLKSLRATPFYTDDYELELERAYERRLVEITDLTLARAKEEMESRKDFGEIHNLFQDLMERSLEIGFTDEQRHRLNDSYELRRENLRREKLEEINRLLETINDVNELKVYWDSIKWYLLNNRPFLGKEFENLVAKRFDESMAEIKSKQGRTLTRREPGIWET